MLAELMYAHHRKGNLERSEADSAADGKTINLAAVDNNKDATFSLMVKATKYIGESSLLACLCFWDLLLGSATDVSSCCQHALGSSMR